jgi:hypothetical protein
MDKYHSYDPRDCKAHAAVDVLVGDNEVKSRSIKGKELGTMQISVTYGLFLDASWRH